jgi:hypothetical protein
MPKNINAPPVGDDRAAGAGPERRRPVSRAEALGRREAHYGSL